MRDLYALYPDYLIDVAAEQAALAGATLVVWQHPIHWYSMPPLMKLWVDEVLAFGWAYGPGRHRAARQGPVAGRQHRRPGGLVPPDSYNRYFFDAFLPPYEQTAALCGMRFLPPLLLHGAHRVGDGRDRGPRRRSTPSAWPATRTGPSSTSCPTAWPARCPKPPARAKRCTLRPAESATDAAP